MSDPKKITKTKKNPDNDDKTLTLPSQKGLLYRKKNSIHDVL